MYPFRHIPDKCRGTDPHCNLSTSPVSTSSASVFSAHLLATASALCVPTAPPAGVNDIIKQQATLLQGATGYRVLIPDLYKGKIGVDKEEANHVRQLLQH